MSNLHVKLQEQFPEYLEADGRVLERAYLEYQEKQLLLSGLLNKALDTAIDTSQKLYGTK